MENGNELGGGFSILSNMAVVHISSRSILEAFPLFHCDITLIVNEQLVGHLHFRACHMSCALR